MPLMKVEIKPHSCDSFYFVLSRGFVKHEHPSSAGRQGWSWTTAILTLPSLDVYFCASGNSGGPAPLGRWPPLLKGMVSLQHPMGSGEKHMAFMPRHWLMHRLHFEAEQWWGTAWTRRELDWCDEKGSRKSSGLCIPECGCRVWSRWQVGSWEDKGCRSWERGILMGKKKKQGERREGKACTITETTMRFSRWCCWWVSATS